MDAIRFDCPECGKKMRVKLQDAGRAAKCADCGTKITVPSAVADTPPWNDLRERQQTFQASRGPSSGTPAPEQTSSPPGASHMVLKRSTRSVARGVKRALAYVITNQHILLSAGGIVLLAIGLILFRIDRAVRNIERRVSRIESTVDHIESTVDHIKSTVDGIEEKVNPIRY